MLNHAARRRRRAPEPPPACCGRPRVAPEPSPPLLPRAVSSPLLATQHRAPAGRHLAAAVHSSGKSPEALSFARIKTRRTPSLFSLRSFADSPTPDPETPLPPSAEHRRAQIAVDPPIQGHFARADPAISTARASRSSLASSRRLSSTRTPSPSSSAILLRRRPACSRRAAATAHPDINTSHQQVRTDLVNLPSPFTLAAGEPSRR